MTYHDAQVGAVQKIDHLEGDMTVSFCAEGMRA